MDTTGNSESFMKNHWLGNRRRREFAEITEFICNKFDLIHTKLVETPYMHKLSVHQAILHIGTVVRVGGRWLLYSYQPSGYVETVLSQFGTVPFWATMEQTLKVSMMYAGMNK